MKKGKGGLFERSREYKDIKRLYSQPIEQSNQVSQPQPRPLRQSMHQFEAPKSAKTLCRERVRRYPSGLAEFSSSCKSPMVSGRGGRYCVRRRNHSQLRVEKRASSRCRAPARLTMLSVAASQYVRRCRQKTCLVWKHLDCFCLVLQCS